MNGTYMFRMFGVAIFGNYRIQLLAALDPHSFNTVYTDNPSQKKTHEFTIRMYSVAHIC